jgi:hypothetical protein
MSGTHARHFMQLPRLPQASRTQRPAAHYSRSGEGGGQTLIAAGAVMGDDLSPQRAQVADTSSTKWRRGTEESASCFRSLESVLRGDCLSGGWSVVCWAINAAAKSFAAEPSYTSPIPPLPSNVTISLAPRRSTTSRRPALNRAGASGSIPSKLTHQRFANPRTGTKKSLIPLL